MFDSLSKVFIVGCIAKMSDIQFYRKGAPCTIV